MRVCPNCGYSTEEDDNFCPYCGQPLMEEGDSKKDEKAYLNTMACPNCGAEVEMDDEFCQNCGHKLHEDVKSQAKEDSFDTYFGETQQAASQQEAPKSKLNTVKECPNCHTKYNYQLTSCPNCGYSDQQETSENEALNKKETQEAVALIIVSAVFGFIGLIVTIATIKRFKTPKAKKLAAISIIVGVVSTILQIAWNFSD